MYTLPAHMHRHSRSVTSCLDIFTAWWLIYEFLKEKKGALWFPLCLWYTHIHTHLCFFNQFKAFWVLNTFPLFEETCLFSPISCRAHHQQFVKDPLGTSIHRRYNLCRPEEMKHPGLANHILSYTSSIATDLCLNLRIVTYWRLWHPLLISR